MDPEDRRGSRPPPSEGGSPARVRADEQRPARVPERPVSPRSTEDGELRSERVVPVVRVEDSILDSRQDRVVVEEPLEIRIDGRPLGVTMRTPGHDEELAAGLLFAEGVVRVRGDIGSIAVCRNPEDPELRNVVDVFLSPGIEPDWERLRRSFLTTSSCGLCGKATIDALRTRADPLDRDALRIRPAGLTRLPSMLRDRQEVFQATGGLHASGLFGSEGALRLLREDVGRHNAVDKVVGAALLANQVPLSESILVVSGRASYEIVQKAVVARIPIVAAVSAPSSLAVDLAREMGVTLVGFLRGETFNVYTHAYRIAV